MKNKIKKFLEKGNICNQDNRKNAGITLVALVITIIILLILAGITIATLSNSGLFNKAQEAKEKWNEAEQDENEKIAKYENELDSYIESDRSTVTTIDYRKGEQKTNEVWVTGKPVYTQAILFEGITKTSKSINHNISNIEDCWIDASNSYWFNKNTHLHGDHNSFCYGASITWVWCSPTVINIGVNYDYPEFNAYIVMKYTKTTDAVIN